MQKVAFVLILLLGAISATGAVLLEETFPYSDGALLSVSSSKWQYHSGATSNQVNVVSQRVFLTQSEGEDVHAVLQGQPYNASSPVTLYTRFTVNFSALPGTGGDYFAHFKGTGTSGYSARCFAMTETAAPGRFRIGIANAGAVPSVIFPTDLELNTDYTVVTKYAVSNAVATLWVNPSSQASQSVTASDTTAAGAVVAFAFRQSGGIGNCYVDDLVVATDFSDLASDVAPAIVSQPADQTAIEGSTVTISAGISGSVPLNIQWHLNGHPLPGETESALTIPSVTEADEGSYFVTVTNAFGGVISDPAFLTVNPFIAYQPAALTLLSYNVEGNDATDWSTNAPQVQAIGRQLVFLQPDIITFQEIPRPHTSEMTNWVKAFMPGYFLAMNSGTDGFIRSVIASRYPITRSESWLARIELGAFGYTSTNDNLDNFSRDLFEAEITVPQFAQPMHVFTTHLKSGGLSEDVAKRAAEASAISNFFVTTFLPTKGNRPYVLTGDMNESNTNQLSIQRLISPPTGLRLTNPQNPVTGSSNTWSSASANPLSRLDYIMPGGLLFSNINNSQVFRTDRLTPVPPGLFSNDCKVASDHLPLLMVFNNPYEGPFATSLFAVTNQTISMTWQSSRGRHYEVESSSNLTNWNLFASGFIGSSTNLSFSTNSTGDKKFFRVKRLP